MTLKSTRRTNPEWIAALRAAGSEQAAALADLRALLVRAARFTLLRARHHVGHLGPSAVDALAEDCAQEALTAITQRLHEFRGESLFTTWAYAFAVNIALTAARRERWTSVSLDSILEDSRPLSATLADAHRGYDPERHALQAELAAAVCDGIDRHLSPRQQQVLRALLIEEIPLDEVVRHLGSNRNAIYKLVHDARVKLKRHLLERGFDVKDMLDLSGGDR